MEYLKDIEFFGAAFKKGEDTEKFFMELVSFIERRVFNRISKRVNFLLTRLNDQRVELVSSDNDDKDQNGNFRITQSGDDWIAQIRSSDVWVTVWKFKGS